MTNEHTPGPWGESFETAGYHGGYDADHYEIYGADYKPVAIVRGHIETMKANACLIAAVPDLLVALERLLDSQRGLNLHEWQQAVADGRNAIAKARGVAPIQAESDHNRYAPARQEYQAERRIDEWAAYHEQERD